MRDDEFNTAAMLKRMQQQVARLRRGGNAGDAVTILQSVVEVSVSTETITVTVDNDPQFTWGVSEWSTAPW